MLLPPHVAGESEGRVYRGSPALSRALLLGAATLIATAALVVWLHLSLLPSLLFCAALCGGAGLLTAATALLRRRVRLLAARVRRRVHDRDEARRLLLAEARALDTFLASTGVALLRLDRDLRVVSSNGRLETWFGIEGGTGDPALISLLRCEPPLGGADPAAAPPDDLGAVVRTCLAAGLPCEREMTGQIPRGDRRSFQVTVSPVRDDRGEDSLALVLVRDVTANRILSSTLPRWNELSAERRVMSEIVHEIGNPLASISARLDRIERRHDEAFTNESLRLIRAQMDRLGRILRSASDALRQPLKDWTACDVNHLLRDVVEMVRMDPRAHRIQFEVQEQSSLPSTSGNTDELTQVFLNLLLNAIEAMPEGGRLRLETRVAGHWIQVELHDSGVGIPPAVLPDVTRAFFTTKPRGTGLGTAISQALVEQHGGALKIDNHPDGGARVLLSLPIRPHN